MENETTLEIDISNVSLANIEKIMQLIRQSGGYVAPKSTAWEPRLLEEYFYIEPVIKKKIAYPSIDPPRTRAVYKTEQEAKDAVKEMTTREVFKRRSIAAGESKNKWTPHNQHWYVYFSEDEGLQYRNVSCALIDGTIYFPTREKLNAAVQELGEKNIKRYLLNVKDR